MPKVGLSELNFFISEKVYFRVPSIHQVSAGIKHMCDMIKRNESDVGDVVFEILGKTVFKFLCFILFLALSNPS